MKGLLPGVLLLTLGASQVASQGRIAIDNPALIATAQARQQLKYLASCALDPDTTLYGVQDGQTYEFPGGMGLAPAWSTRALTLAERRWVSACILARTNAFGVSVQISMRATDTAFASLSATPDEINSHSLYEGAFYGDLFAEQATAFVCVGSNHASDQHARARRQRVCTDVAQDGSALTQCGFVQTGLCPTGSPPEVDGVPWPQVIHVWLAGNDPT